MFYYTYFYFLYQNISGDRLLATASGNQSFGTPQDVALTLSYPKSGVGGVVTFVQVDVDQVSFKNRIDSLQKKENIESLTISEHKLGP